LFVTIHHDRGSRSSTRAPSPGASTSANDLKVSNYSCRNSHASFQDVNGIRVVNNTFGPNNLAGDPDVGVTSTTGILLLSVAVPVNIVWPATPSSATSMVLPATAPSHDRLQPVLRRRDAHVRLHAARSRR